MFCSKCGRQLIAGGSFCANCGNRITIPQAPTYQQPIQPQPPQQPLYRNTIPGGEDVLLVMKATRRLTLTNSIVCHIVFKRNWLVLAHVTPLLTSLETARLQESLKAQNLGVMKRSAAQMHFWGNFHKRYYAMTTDAILAEDPTNLAINYGTISSVSYSCSYSTSDEDTSYDHDGLLHLTLINGDTFKFKHRDYHDKSKKDVLTGLFGQRLRYKK